MLERYLRRSIFLVLLGACLATPGRSAEPASAGGCREGATRICLLGRFEVEATWFASDGTARAATALPLTAKGGAFSFFDSDGADLLVQVDPGHLDDGRMGVRFGALVDTAFTLRVLDTSTAGEWRHEASMSRPRPVSDRLEEESALRGPVSATVEASRCEASATDLCLLEGRFRVRALFAEGARLGAARPAGETGRSGVFTLGDPERVDLAVRIVDGRSINGSYWVLASGLGAIDATLEVSDLESGRTRWLRFDGGAPTQRLELEAFSGAAATARITLDPSRAVTAPIGPAGGSIQVTNAQGTRFAVAFPARALATVTDITVTPIATMSGAPFSGGLKGGVRVAPEGLIPAATVKLTITPSAAVAPAQRLTFALRGLNGELFLAPSLAGAAIVVPIHRLGSFGLGAGTSTELSAQLLRLPSREEDRLNQKLAGLVLPLRRAGKVVPAGAVSQMLQQEFNARIKARLLDVKKGNLEKNYPQITNWSLNAQDFGLVKPPQGTRLAPLAAADPTVPQEAQVESTEIAAARAQFVRDFAVCIGSKDVKAMRRVFLGYSTLVYLKAPVTQADVDKLLRCVRFELDWDTELSFTDANQGAPFIESDSINLDQPLTYSLGRSVFFSAPRATTQFLRLVFNGPPCLAALVASPPPISFAVDSLYVSTLNWYDEEVSPARMEVALNYSISPALAFANWQITCDDTTDENFAVTSWTALYTIAHPIRKETLRPFPSGTAPTFAQMEYHRDVEEVGENTYFDLYFKPQ